MELVSFGPETGRAVEQFESAALRSPLTRFVARDKIIEGEESAIAASR